MSFAIQGAIESGLLFAIMALGVYITFRILNFPDLTVDGSFTLGGAIAAVLVTAGHSPLLAALIASIFGSVAGMVTGLLHTKGKIDPLLSGILMMIALYSINLRIMGKANVGLLGETTVFTKLDDVFQSIPLLSEWNAVVSMAVVVVILSLLLRWFFRSEIGLAVRATGDNEKMIRSFSANTDTTKIIGLSMSNGLVSLSGALMAQYQGFADVSMGIGMIVIGLASVIIGEFVFRGSTIGRAAVAVIGGSLLYRLIIAFALKLNLNPMDMKLITALIVVVALVSPRMFRSLASKRKWTSVNRGGRSEKHAEA